jgi:hypothetical protein
MIRMTNIWLAALLSSTLVVPQDSVAQDEAVSAPDDQIEVDATVDAIERQLEIKRHEKLLVRIAENDTTMTDFWTDGCSGGLSAGWDYLSDQFPDVKARHGEHPPWESCCEVHDVAYHEGGLGSESAADSFDQRKAADLELLSCVTKTAEQRSDELNDLYDLSESQVALLYKSIAELMYRAVRLGGIPCTNQPWRWGYGWPNCE